MLQRRFPQRLPLLEVFHGVQIDDLNPLLPKLGLFSSSWVRKQMDLGCAEDSGACLKSQPCLHLLKENQQENAEGLSQAPLRDMSVHPGSTKIHPKPVGDFWGMLSLLSVCTLAFSLSIALTLLSPVIAVRKN